MSLKTPFAVTVVILLALSIGIGQAPPVSVSINNGVFLCVECEALHTQLDSNVSNIIPLSEPDWKSHGNFLYLKLGGNRNFNSFLKLFNLDHESVPIKYKSKAAAFYRKQLDAQILGKAFVEEPPSYAEGREDISYVPKQFGSAQVITKCYRRKSSREGI
eukprot:TRINITY_DN94202_c0_g1_i1.p3 TRINITY_DN94202_c0_g1~~TRINITY_DN94202_c0_g1_i1.p3  ORF type:complete len:160 (-),score=17.42 TRINITY_DN94202_c0_g1_i1:330-809(-)